MSIYASKSNVSVEHSKAEIERNLARWGASHFIYATDHKQARIGFVYQGRNILLKLPLPNPDDFQYTPSGRKRRNKELMLVAWEQECRSSWRELNLLIKAKLIAIQRKTASFEDEFLAYTALPGGQTIGDIVTPQINRIIETGEMPNLLLPAGVERQDL